MSSGITGFLAKHTTIKNKAILLIYFFIILYKIDFTIFQFALTRFLRDGFGSAFLVIGILLSFANFLVMMLDIPLGVLQKYIKPRIFLIVSVLFLLLSNLIFIFVDYGVVLALLAVFLYQISVEIFFITITTYIFRLSTPKDYSQNVAQQDFADNIGDIIGSIFAGILLLADRLLQANHFFVGAILLCLIFLLLLFIYEHIDRKQYTFLENYIRGINSYKYIENIASSVSDEIVIHDESEVKMIENEENIENKLDKITVSPKSLREYLDELKSNALQISTGFKQSFGAIFYIFTNRSEFKILFWTTIIMIVTSFWSEAINDFQPIFIKDLYHADTSGWVTDNIPRFFYESFVFIAALAIPTFFLEIQFGKLADTWGKERVVLVGVAISSISILGLGIMDTPVFAFIFLVLLGCGFVITYPSLVGLFNETFQNFTKSPLMKFKTDQMSDGDTAGIIAIIMNIGQISGALIAGVLFEALPFYISFFIFGFFLLILLIWSTKYVKIFQKK